MISVSEIWLTDNAVWIRTDDGREACEYFADYPRLRDAAPEQRADYSADAFGIHWAALDEDLCFDGFFRQRTEGNMLYNLFMEHPEINASAVARRLDMSQSLLAQYISGAKRPSRERLELIVDEIKKIGRELSSLTLTPADDRVGRAEGV